MLKILKFLLAVLVFLPGTLFAAPTQVEWLLNGFTDDDGQALSGGKVYTYSAGTLVDKATWSDLAGTTAHANPIILDGQGKKQVFADGLYKFVVKDSSDNTLYTYDNLAYGNYTGVVSNGGTSSGAANIYNITVAPSPVSYATGQRFTFTSHQTNTTAATINVNSISSKSIVSTTNQALVGGEIQSGAVIEVMYDGTSFRIVSTTTLPRIQQAYSSSADSESSAAYNAMTGASVTVSVKTGDYVKINWWATWSVDNVDTIPGFQIFEGSTGIASTIALGQSTGDVGNQGNHKTHAGSYILTTPTAGSQTYTLQWIRTAGANIAYSARRYISVEVVSP